MKILKQGITEIYDYTCEEIIEETCPELLAYNSSLHTYVACPCCEHKITIW